MAIYEKSKNNETIIHSETRVYDADLILQVRESALRTSHEW